MTHKKLIVTRLLTPLLLLCVILGAPASATPQKPNILIMVADDLGWADVGYHGGDIDTPSLDLLAQQGVRLNRFYTTPICSPTRAALMTGRDPIRLGVTYGVIFPWDNIGVHPDEHFMPETFQAAGYQTAIVGKWHLGHAQMTYHPNNRGFEHFYGHLHTEVGFYPPFSNQGGKDFQRNGVSIDDQGYETYLLADEVSRYIRERDRDRPFLVYMPFIAPHTPLDAPAELQDKYKDIETDLPMARSRQTDDTRLISRVMLQPSARPMYAAVVDGLDQAIGQVLDTLAKEGIEEETIILFSSDNGGAAYAGGGADNFPLRGGKGDTYEGGIRVVAAMRWKGTLDAGKSFESIMTVMDVFPTLASAAGVSMLNTKEIWGRDLWSAIQNGKNIKLDKEIYFASETPNYGEFHTTVFNDKWKLVQVITSSLLEINVENKLFDINADPNEYNNLADEYPKLVEIMANKIREWRALHPISGIRAQLVPPPGWRAPKDWTSYTIPIEDLQEDASLGFGAHAHQILDYLIKDHGRIIYDCKPGDWERGKCKAPESLKNHQHQ